MTQAEINARKISEMEVNYCNDRVRSTNARTKYNSRTKDRVEQR